MKFGNPLGFTTNISNATIAVTGNVNANITNASIPVSGNVNANITNASIAVTGTLNANITNATLNVGGTVSLSAGTVIGVSSITSTVNVSLGAATINVQGVAGGTAIGVAGSVTISSGTVNIGTVAGNITVSQIINNVNVQSPVTTIFSTQAVAATTAGTTITWVATVPAEGFRIRILNSTGTANIFAVVQNNSQGATPIVYAGSIPGSNSGAEFGVNIPANVGDTISFRFQSLSAVTQNITVTIVETDGEPATPPTQPGQPISNYPVGGGVAIKFITVVGNVAVLPVIQAGLAYRLHRLIMFNGPSGWLTGVTSGVIYGVIEVAPGKQSDNLDGQIVTEALVFNSGTAGATCTLTYDVVSQPALI